MKNSFKRTFAFFLAVVMITAALPITALAAVFGDADEVFAYRYTHPYTGSDGKVYADVKDYNYLKYTAKNTPPQILSHSANTSGHATLGVGTGAGQQRAYCIEAGVDIFGSEPRYKASNESNAAYLKWLPDDQQKLLKLALLCGSHFEGDSKVPVSGCNDDDFAFATQVIIWEIQQSLRTGYKPSDLADNSAGTPALTFYNQLKGRPAEKCYTYILDQMKKHSIVPSFTVRTDNAKNPTLPTHTLKYDSATKDYRITLTDSNNTGVTLKKTAGITVEKNGNNYTFKSTNKITSAVTCTYRKENVTNDDNLIVWANTNYNKDGQHLATGYSDPVTFGAKFVTEDNGSITIDKIYTYVDGTSNAGTGAIRNVLEFKVKNNSTGKYIKASGSDGSYTYTGTDTEANAKAFKFKKDSTSGKITISDVPAGAYTVIETKGNTGYTCTGGKVVTVTVGNAVNARIENKQVYLQIDKLYEQADGSTLSAAKLKEYRNALEFKITKSNGAPLKFTTGSTVGNDVHYTYNGNASGDGTALKLKPNTSTGKIIVDDLPIGETFIVKETKGNAGYTCASKTVTIAIGENTVEMTNSEDTGHAQIKKVWKPTPAASLNDAIYFTVKNSAGKYITATHAPSALAPYIFSGTTSSSDAATKFKVNSSSGIFELQYLPVGTYTVYEHIDENHAMKEEAKKYRMDAASKTVTVKKDETGTVTFNNKQTVSLTIHKTFEGEENMTPEEMEAEYAKVSFYLHFTPPMSSTKWYMVATKDASGEYTYNTFTSSESSRTLFGLDSDGYCDIDLNTLNLSDLAANLVVVETYSGTKYTADMNKIITRPTSAEEIIELPEIVFNNPKKKGNLNINKVFNLPANATALTDEEKKSARNELRFVVQEKITHSDGTVDYVYITADGSDGSYTYTGTSPVPTEFSFAANSVSGAIEIANVPIGDYIVTETVSCTNFTCDGDADVTVTEGNTATATIYNTLDNGFIEVDKIFKNEGGTAITVSPVVLSQIEFAVKDKSGKYVTAIGSDGSYTYTGLSASKTVFKLNNSGNFSISDLPARQKYTVAEVKGADGFSYVSSNFDLEVLPNQTDAKVFTNEAMKGKIKIVKRSSNGVLSGWKFRVRCTSSVFEDWSYDEIHTTDANGEILIENLRVGDYEVSEDTTGVVGYITPDSTTVTVTNGNTTPVNANNYAYGSIKILKVSSTKDNTTPVSGATFGIYSDAACTTPAKAYKVVDGKVTNALVNAVVYELSSSLGTYAADYLPINSASGTKYYVKELTAPAGFVMNTNVFDVTKKSTTTAEIITVYEAQWGNLEITKKDTASGEKLTGATFSIYTDAACTTAAKKYKVVSGVVTSTLENAVITETSKGVYTASYLPYGTYYVKETKAPASHALDSAVHTVTVGAIPAETVKIDINNTRFGSVEITKVDKDYPANKVSGATYGIYTNAACTTPAKAFKVVSGVVTSTLENAVITETSKGVYKADYLPIEAEPTTYYVKELTAAPNYTLDNTVYPLTVNGATGGTKPNMTLTHNEAAQEGDLKIIKHSADGKVSGWKFRVHGTAFTGQSYDETFITDANGEILIENLRVGIYEVSEDTTGVVGYITPEAQTVTIEHDKLVQKDFTNIPIGNVHITKTDKDYPDSKLSGAEFAVYKADKTTVVGKLTEISVGEYQLNDLQYGNYFVRETKAPEYFVPDNNFYAFSITEAGATVTVKTPSRTSFINDAQRGDIKVVKHSADGKVSGWKFRVECTSSPFDFYEYDEIFTTDENGEISVSGLRIGTYRITEQRTGISGYFFPEAKEETVTFGSAFDVEFTNVPYGKITIAKVDRDDHTVAVSGSTYTVYKDVDEDGIYNEDVDTFFGTMTESETEKGKYEIDEVPYGKYLVKETEAPEGWLVDENYFSADIDSAEDVVNVTNDEDDVFIEAPIEGSVYITKVDVDYPDNKLTGAEFTIYAEDKETVIGVLEEIAIGEYRLDNIRYGDYFLKETKAPEYFIADDNLYHFSIREQDEIIVISNNEVGTTSFANSPQKGALKIAKSSSDGTVEGFEFEVTGTAYTGQEYAEIFKTDANGEILIENLRVGDYTVRELDNDLTLSYILPADKMLLIENGEQSIVDMYNDEVTIKTTATVEGEKETYATGTVTLTDTVSYTNLTIGKEYTLKGVLMDKSTGERLLINGEPVTAETTFTAETKDGEIAVEFVFDASAIKTETETVVFEALYRDGKEIAVHTDIEDEGQTVIIKTPKIHTTATIEGGKEVYANRIVTLDDKVSYTNLTVGKEYTLKGVLMDKATEKPFTVNGKEITSELTFIPTEKDGEVTVTFTFDTSTVTEDTDVVVFESLYRDGIELITHTNINDKDQTVKIKTPPDNPFTGVKCTDITNPLLLCCIFTAIVILTRKKRFVFDSKK